MKRCLLATSAMALVMPHAFAQHADVGTIASPVRNVYATGTVRAGAGFQLPGGQIWTSLGNCSLTGGTLSCSATLSLPSNVAVLGTSNAGTAQATPLDPSLCLNSGTLTVCYQSSFGTAAIAAPAQAEQTRAQAAEALLAPKASPSFTGTVTLPDNSTLTGLGASAGKAYPGNNPSGFVTAAQAGAAAPVQSVAGRSGAITLSVGDVTGAAPAASPAFSGTITLPDSSTLTGLGTAGGKAYPGTNPSGFVNAAGAAAAAPVQTVAGHTGTVTDLSAATATPSGGTATALSTVATQAAGAYPAANVPTTAQLLAAASGTLSPVAVGSGCSLSAGTLSCSGSGSAPPAAALLSGTGSGFGTVIPDGTTVAITSNAGTGTLSVNNVSPALIAPSNNNSLSVNTAAYFLNSLLGLSIDGNPAVYSDGSNDAGPYIGTQIAQQSSNWATGTASHQSLGRLCPSLRAGQYHIATLPAAFARFAPGCFVGQTEDGYGVWLILDNSLVADPTTSGSHAVIQTNDAQSGTNFNTSNAWQYNVFGNNASIHGFVVQGDPTTTNRQDFVNLNGRADMAEVYDIVTNELSGATLDVGSAYGTLVNGFFRETRKIHDIRAHQGGRVSKFVMRFSSSGSLASDSPYAINTIDLWHAYGDGIDILSPSTGASGDQNIMVSDYRYENGLWGPNNPNPNDNSTDYTGLRLGQSSDAHVPHNIYIHHYECITSTGAIPNTGPQSGTNFGAQPCLVVDGPQTLTINGTATAVGANNITADDLSFNSNAGTLSGGAPITILDIRSGIKASATTPSTGQSYSFMNYPGTAQTHIASNVSGYIEVNMPAAQIWNLTSSWLNNQSSNATIVSHLFASPPAMLTATSGNSSIPIEYNGSTGLVDQLKLTGGDLVANVSSNTGTAVATDASFNAFLDINTVSAPDSLIVRGPGAAGSRSGWTGITATAACELASSGPTTGIPFFGTVSGGSITETCSPTAGTISLSVANSGATAGTYGSASAVPVLTIGADGRVSNATTAAIASQSYPSAGIPVSTSTTWATSLSHTAHTASAPVISSVGTGATITLGTCSNSGTYEQLGSMIFDHGSLSCTVSALTGTLTVSLPAASASDGIAQSVTFNQVGSTQTWPNTTSTQIVGRIPSGSAYFYIEGNKNAGGATVLSSSNGCTAGCTLNLNFSAIYDTGSGS